MITSKLEVLVDLGPKTDTQLINKTLNSLKSQDGVSQALYKDGAVKVETTLPSAVVLDLIAKTSGRRAVLQGFGGVAKWGHIVKFYELDNSNPNFVFAPLLQEHLNPNTKQKMRVKLAVQVLSHTVAAGMFTKIAQSNLVLSDPSKGFSSQIIEKEQFFLPYLDSILGNLY